MSTRPRFPLVVLGLVAASVGASSLQAGAAPAPSAPRATGAPPLRRPPVGSAGTTSPRGSATATASTTPTASQSAAPTASAPLPTGKPDLRCEILAWGKGNAPVADGGNADGILEANGMHSVEYALRVKNVGGPAGAAFVVRYDYVQKIGNQTNTSSKPNIPFPALGAGQEVQTPRLKMSGSGPFPGWHEVKVTLDTGSAVEEADETNNTCKLGVNLY